MCYINDVIDKLGLGSTGNNNYASLDCGAKIVDANREAQVSYYDDVRMTSLLIYTCSESFCYSV